MKIYNGECISGGVAIGKIVFIKKKKPNAEHTVVLDSQSEKKRFFDALEAAKRELENLYECTKQTVNEESAEIFDIHKMMLEDDDYINSIIEEIENNHTNAEYAVCETGKKFAKIFSSMDDEYMKSRSVDVEDISQRVVSSLKGEKCACSILSEPSIVVADELTPSETVQLDKRFISAIVSAKGSALSHAAILANIMNIPALIGADIPLEESLDGKTAAVDAYNGKIYLEPDKDVLSSLQGKIEEDKKRLEQFEKYRGKETVTADNKKIMLYCNISSPDDADYVLKNDAEGIGLFRSEFLYMGRATPPNEEEQFNAYKQVAEKMKDKCVIIRTFDLGADKQAEFMEFEAEENPALGMRGIRLSLSRENLFRTQLRAICRAAVYGNLYVMYPMISSLSEIHRVKAICKSVQEELINNGEKTGEIKQGIMIETPASAIISDELAKEVDFFSIGTNDLTQYTLAADRQNQSLGETYDMFHPAIFRLIEMVCENAHKNNIWVGLCGELGGKEDAIPKLIDLGIDELSVSPKKVLPTRRIISNSQAHPQDLMK